MSAHKSGFISLIGRPNSGKSTLLNTILHEKVSIVSDKPQTTRNGVLGILTRETHQIIFMDTPGIHRPHYEMNRRMMAITRTAAEGMDLIVLIIDGSLDFGRGDQFVIEMLTEIGKPVILLINKIDIIQKPRLLPLMDRYRRLYAFEEIIPASALTGENVDLLERGVAERLPEGPAYFDAETFTDQPERFLAAELIREKVLRYTREELPYTTGVVVEQFEDIENPRRVSIHASIYVERASQKGIIIGKGGSRLKRIGTESREEIGRLLAAKVNLFLHIKVKKGWRDNFRLLREMGLDGDR
ncbi:GTPase Era [Acidobacteriota bacterium]